MPLNLVVGNKGLGKTSFLVYQGRKTYFERGELIKRQSIERTTQITKMTDIILRRLPTFLFLRVRN